MKQNLFIKSLIITSALITFSAGTFSASAATISPTEVVSITSSWSSVNTYLSSTKLGWVGHYGSAAFSGGNLTLTPKDGLTWGNVFYYFNLTDIGASSISEIETQGMTISFNSSIDGAGFEFALPGANINPTFTQNTITQGMNTLYIPGETAKTYFGTSESTSKAKDGYALLGMTVANTTKSPVTISNLQVSLGQAIPEPSSVGLLAGAGMFALVGLRRRKH